MRTTYLLAIIALFFQFSAHAISVSEQRKLFEQAEYQAKKGHINSYRKSLKKLGDYPLSPYVELAYLKKHPYLVNKKRIRKFLSLYSGTPLEWRLRKPWLKYLGQKGHAIEFIHDYKSTENAELNCYKIRSELLIGATLDSVADSIGDLWVVGKSQPRACDPIFKKWKQAGYQSVDFVKERVELAANGGKHTLLPYLIKQLPTQLQYWGKLWHKTRRDPRYISNFKRFKNFNRDELDIFVYGVRRLIWKDKDLAIKLWKRAQKKFRGISEADKLSVNKRFSIALASKGDQRAINFLKKIPYEEIDNKLAHWYLASYLQEKEWRQVVNLVQSLPSSINQELIYQYWLSRALLELGSEAKARKHLKKIAKHRHYYGFLASAYLKQTSQLNNYPYQADPKDLKQLSMAPAAKRAFEFRKIGREVNARIEWWHFKRSLSDEEKATAAVMASKWKWHDQALSTISQAGYKDDVNLRFPLAYQEEFKRYSKQNKLPLSLSLAIARRESSFMADAHSPVGAKGLMQLMPNTAKQVAGKRMSTKKLTNANTNIKLGTKYLSGLIKRTDGVTPVAIASYNAGINRATKWLPKEEPVAFDLWVETIPYKETREYVKSVLAYQQVYENLLNQNNDVFSNLVNKKMIKSK